MRHRVSSNLFAAATNTSEVVFSTHAKLCSGTQDHGGLSTSTVDIVGLADVTEVGWNRFWIIPLNKHGQRTCRGGDAFEVQLESATAKISVDIVFDLQNGIPKMGIASLPGLYEVHVFVRSSGKYALCVDPHYSFGIAQRRGLDVGRFWFNLSALDVEQSGDFVLPQGHYRESTLPTEGELGGEAPSTLPHCNRRRSWSNAICSAHDIQLDQQQVNALNAVLVQQRRENNCGHPLAMRSGSWIRLLDSEGNPRTACDGLVCVGPPHVPFLAESKGWVWASDWCVMRLYSVTEAWSVVKDRWLVAWGGSTLKQPFANFIEYQLNVPIFSKRMEELHLHPGPVKRRPGFFSYRQFDSLRTQSGEVAPTLGRDSARFTMLWGGCPNIGAPPNCGNRVGMNNRAHLQRTVLDGASKQVAPSVIIINHFVWRHPQFNETAFVETFHDTLEFIADLLHRAHNVTPLKRRTILLWLNGVRHVHSDSNRQCSSESVHLLTRRLAMRVESAMVEHEKMWKGRSEIWVPQLRVLSRFDLTMPFHFSDRYVHFGVHYGATRGMCLTGIDHKRGYELSQCLRETWVDAMLYVQWLNVIDALQK